MSIHTCVHYQNTVVTLHLLNDIKATWDFGKCYRLATVGYLNIWHHSSHLVYVHLCLENLIF